MALATATGVGGQVVGLDLRYEQKGLLWVLLTGSHLIRMDLRTTFMTLVGLSLFGSRAMLLSHRRSSKAAFSESSEEGSPPGEYLRDRPKRVRV